MTTFQTLLIVVTEVFYVISGSGTLVTGGTVENDRSFPSRTS